MYQRFCGMSADERHRLNLYHTLLVGSLADLSSAAGPRRLRMVVHLMFPHDLPLLPVGEPAVVTAPTPVVPPPAVRAAYCERSADHRALLKDVVQALAGQGQVLVLVNL